MRGHINDCLRTLISRSITLAGFALNCVLRLQIVGYALTQKRLNRKYRINRDTAILSYGPQVSQWIQDKAGPNAKFAKTSGSTGAPKEVLYTKRRLLALKCTFSDMFARACYAFDIKRTSLYVFNSFETDGSLTSLLLEESTLPNFVSTLQAPYRVQHHPAIRALLSEYTPAAIRLWILAISNPGVLYSTNPSTISTFLDELANEWPRSSKLVKDWHENPAAFSGELHHIAWRLASRGWAKRVQRIADAGEALPLSVCAPGVKAYVCWTGGYVKPFLDRLAQYLPTPRYKLIPMYSMSTETIETLPHFRGEDVTFLPVARGVVYEFIENGKSDDPENLLNARELEPQKLYAMVVSDRYGLRRHQTDDLFLCKRKVSGLPDLVFMRRRSLEYSFTGEKLTAEQLSMVFEQLRRSYPSLVGESFLTCVPSRPAHGLPHYKLLLVGSDPCTSPDLLAARCDELLSEINCEYKSKRASGRLGPITVVDGWVKEFPSQFKFLPLYRCEDDTVGAALRGRASLDNNLGRTTGGHGVPPLQ